MSLGNATNNNLFALTSPVIDFSVTGVVPLFTTAFNSRFCPIFSQNICVFSNSADGNSQYNIGWTGPDYMDYDQGAGFQATVTDETSFVDPGSTSKKTFPPNTVIRVNITQADSGIALTGRIIIYGIYI
jgi:hypothetical protein